MAEDEGDEQVRPGVFQRADLQPEELANPQGAETENDEGANPHTREKD